MPVLQQKINYHELFEGQKMEADKEIKQLKKEIKKLKSESEEMRLLIDFVVHDLKNPLSTIEMNYEIINDAIEEDGSLQKYSGVNSLIKSQIIRMKGLILELLNISRIEGSRLQLNPVTVNTHEFLQSIVEENAGLIKNNEMNLILKTDSPVPDVQLDEALIRRVLANLIVNAVNHSVSSPEIILHANKKGKRVIFSVEDFGTGIPKKDMKKIFEKFGQSPKNKNEKRENHGLGLYFCKLVTQLHGDGIKVKSTEGKGSTFSFSVPSVP
ncbi:MAG: HAMP domain-containing histidine kinase [Nitrospinae bacterium]|nr:HAMP domain-containing histidine kinase [Nitrospinota bacterium]